MSEETRYTGTIIHHIHSQKQLLCVQVRVSPYPGASGDCSSKTGHTRPPDMYLAIQAHAQSLTHTVPHTQGKYGYQYIEEGEGEFVSRVGQRNMIKDIIKQEIVLAEGEQRECLETEIHYCLTAGLFPVGCYVYPFLYQLPHNLPGKKKQFFLRLFFPFVCPARIVQSSV